MFSQMLIGWSQNPFKVFDAMLLYGDIYVGTRDVLPPGGIY
jgi:hypothetical protein